MENTSFIFGNKFFEVQDYCHDVKTSDFKSLKYGHILARFSEKFDHDVRFESDITSHFTFLLQ